MGRSPKFETGNTTALVPAEAIDRLGLALIRFRPDPVATHSVAHAHARACLDVNEDSRLLLAGMLETSAPGSRPTRH